MYLSYHHYNNPQHKSLASELIKNELPLKSDATRYLAHAGGEINGDRYTNSLEALNLNYSLGFRVFEIDIITTSDGHLVCAHDWESWKRFTNFEGDTPPTLNEFLKHKIKKGYTPISLKMIHEWFINHPEAILFTDKINDPEKVSSVFTSKSQLIMKLVSFPAVKKAATLNIEIAIGENILNSMKKNVVQQLQNLDVKHIVISIKSIKNKESLLLDIKKAGIKTYAQHVNFEKGKDELYIFNNEMDFLYGFYADVWDFNK